MFKKSKTNQPTIFEGLDMLLNKKGQKLISNPGIWFNLFRTQVYDRIDEELFSVLFDPIMGRSNSSVRLLVGMIILKEGFQITDEQLFMSCELDLGYRKALGLHNIDEEIPVPATYYDFKRKIHEHYEITGTSLMNEAFLQITTEQVSEFSVGGKKIRLDSKLIQSNIARCTRLGLIIKTIQKFLKCLESGMLSTLDKKWRLMAEAIIASSSDNQQFGLSDLAKQEKLIELGKMIKAMLVNSKLKGVKEYNLLKRLFEEQYYISGKGKIMVKENKVISADSLQSPHDPDAAYRKKGNQNGSGTQTVNGYCANITETCNHKKDEPKLDFIVSAEVGSAVKQDGEFLYVAIKDSKTTTGELPESLITDGGYSNNEEEQKIKSEFPEITHIKTGLVGRMGEMEYIMDESNEPQYIFHRGIKKKVIIVQKKDGSKIYKIKDKKQNSGFRYISHDQIAYHFKRKELENMPIDIKNIRPPIESTINQVFCGLEGNKSKYRGLAKTISYVISRCIWTNFRRIEDKICKKGKWKGLFSKIYSTIFYKIYDAEIQINSIIKYRLTTAIYN